MPIHKVGHTQIERGTCMELKTCCFTGHRELPQEKRPEVEAAIRQELMAAIEDGYTRFLCGFAKGADLMFAALVAELKGQFPGLRLMAAIPYLSRLYQKDRAFHDLVAACDDMKIISEERTRDCYLARNRYMVDESSRVIAVYDGREKGGTKYTIHYANKQEKEVRTIRI